MDLQKNLCKGCGITLPEREHWSRLSNETKANIVERLARTRKRTPRGKTQTRV